MTLQELLQSERQWKRDQRIAHARLMMKKGPMEDRPVWREVLAAHFDTQPHERKSPNGHKHRNERRNIPIAGA